MDKKESKIPIIIAGTVASAVGLYLLYRYFNQSQNTNVSQVKRSDETNFLEQAASYELKKSKGKQWMEQYVNKNQLNQLRCVKGVLNREDFYRVQKTCEIYVKCVLYEIRIKHQLARIDYLKSNNIIGYVGLQSQQLNIESDEYEKAQNDVKAECHISDQVFGFSQMEYGQDEQSLRDAITFSLLSPFQMKRAFTYKQTKEIFMKAADKALKRVQQNDLEKIEIVQQKDYILILFDTLFMDYAYIDYQIHSEEFRAAISNYNLINEDSEVKNKLEDIVKVLYTINSKFDEQ